MKQTIQIFLEGEGPTLKYDLIKTDGIVKNKKKTFFQLFESPIFNTNPSNIKLQMLQEGKQLEEKIQAI